MTCKKIQAAQIKSASRTNICGRKTEDDIIKESKYDTAGSGSGGEKILDGFGIPFSKDLYLKYTYKTLARMKTTRGYYRYVTLVLTNKELYLYNDLKLNRNY